MNSVSIQFCAFKSFWGRLFPWFSQGKVGHVDIVLPSGDLLGAQHEDGLGGEPSGVRVRPADYLASCGGTSVIRVSFDATPQQAQAFYDFAHAQVGKPYDTRGILAFIFGRNWRDDRAWFCSELAAAALEAAGIVRRLSSPANKITPAGLLLVCSALADVTPAA